MNVLVLGGTGAMGKHLVSLLADASNRVIVTSRTRSGHNGHIEYIKGNAKEESFLNELLAQHWEVIVDFMVYKTNEFQDRYEKLLNATDHYIYLSSSRVYADSNQPLKETSPRLLDVSTDQDYLATDEYALTKARQENLLFASTRKNWTIIRPYITYDEERLQLGVLEKEDWLYRALRGRTILLDSEINSKLTTLTSGFDVAQGIKALLHKPDSYAEVFHITSDISICWNEVLDTYSDILNSHLGEHPSIIWQNTRDFLGWRGGRYQVIYDRLYNRQFDNTKINKYIDTSKFITPETGLKECLNQFLKANNRQFRWIDWEKEASKDIISNENASIFEVPTFKQKIKYCIFRYLKP